MTIVGIDPGLDGGVAILVPGDAPRVFAMPTLGTGRRELHVYELRRWFHLPINKGHVVIERQQSMPGQGVKSTFTTGENYGILLGIAIGVYVGHTIVPAKQWQKMMFSGLDRRLDTKTKSILRARQLFPEVSLRATERCKKDHHGMSDALLIAEWGRRTLRAASRGEAK